MMHSCYSSSLLLSIIFLVVSYTITLTTGAKTESSSSRSSGCKSEANFYENYKVLWGADHASILNQGREAQLSMDKSSGSGIQSKLSYKSGFFNMKIKLHDKDSAGVVSTFYVTSHGNNHDELDFEFLGNRESKPYTLQTNVFANGEGNREQRFNLWFDPSADFHIYPVEPAPNCVISLFCIHLFHFNLWFYIDGTPIRIFKNNTSFGVPYPIQAMQIEASIWNGEDWATDGGQTKIDWSHAPFLARFQGFNVDGCSNNNAQDCYSATAGNWWNGNRYWRLNSTQMRAYDNVRSKYMNYDYCTDKTRFPTPPPECPV